jgi:hypothetical protein
MSLYLPDGCTQEMLDRYLDGDGPFESEQTDEEIECEEQMRFEWEAEMYFEWLQDVDERAKHLAGGVVDGPPSGVERPLVNDLDF